GPRAVVLNVNLSAGLRDDALDGLTAGTDERADLLRIDFDRLNPWRVFGQFRPGLVQRTAHDVEDFRARFLRALDRFRHYFVANAGELQVELKSADACVCSAKLKIHVTEMIFRADDVGEQFVALYLLILAAFSHNPDRASRNR